MKAEFKNLEGMDTVNKAEYPEVFFEDEQMRDEDKAFFTKVFDKEMSPNERRFFERMKEKVEGEFAPSADIMMIEDSNEEEVFIIRYYFHEFKIGKHNWDEAVYEDSFSKFIRADMYILLGRHVTLLEWLREIDFKGVNYNGNCILNRN